jgi:outer membrane lipoprotein-sorting protein
MNLSRRTRWAVPGTVVVVAAGVIAALQIPAAQASPVLPVRSPAQLLAEISNDAKLPPLTGTVVETTSLGLPQLPDSGSPTSLASMITGSHTVKVYYQDASHFRLAVPETDSETDVIADGTKAWLWDSESNSVTEFLAPAGKHAEKKLPPVPVLTPQQAASQVLTAVGKTTLVSVQSNVMIAGEPAYQLVLAPKDHRSLVGKVMIAIDAKYGMPLRVEVFAKGSGSPAFQVGYTALQFTAPAPANYEFTPPPGASVKVVKLGSGGHAAMGTGQQRDASGFGSYGTGWLTVAELPLKDLMQGLGTGGADSGTQSSTTSGPAGVMSGDSQQVLGALIGSATPVHGAWGSGTLLTTSLFSVLMTGGEVYIGAVQPSVLYAAVGHTTS